jgi:hypothetical protein
VGVRRKFFARWPGNYNSLSLDLAAYFGWSPAEIDEMEGDRLVDWARRVTEIEKAKANRIPRRR